METHFEHIEAECNLRGFHGVSLNNTEFEQVLVGPVHDNLIDSEVVEAMLSELTGLSETGFSESESLLADIQTLKNPTPDDLRDWRIGETLAEVTLEKKFNCRFHWNELRDSRNPNGNKTGPDLVGFFEIDDSVFFLFGEVKTSSEDSRPPQVMTKLDGIENQLINLFCSNHKRQILIAYLKSKTLDLPDEHAFKKDFKLALRSYYGHISSYQLIGVLVRDILPDPNDITISFNRIKNTILNPIGLKLIALYTPIKKDAWREIILSDKK